MTFTLTLLMAVQPWKRLPGKPVHECFIFSESLVNKTRKSQHTVRLGAWRTMMNKARASWASLPKDRRDVTTRWHPIWHVTNATDGTIVKRHPHIVLCFLCFFTEQLVQIMSTSICFQRHPSIAMSYEHRPLATKKGPYATKALKLQQKLHSCPYRPETDIRFHLKCVLFKRR